ncbi:MAG: hypothetical protein M1815_004641 [Lichina confinis]|nr:MAG: hypothetical protein M1815_004641 [Lichina confinis]
MKSTLALAAAFVTASTCVSAQPFRLGKRVNLGSCNPEIAFTEGNDGQGGTFAPVDQETFTIEPSNDVNTITEFICSQLTSKSQPDQNAVVACAQGQQAAGLQNGQAAGKQDRHQFFYFRQTVSYSYRLAADAFNNALGEQVQPTEEAAETAGEDDAAEEQAEDAAQVQETPVEASSTGTVPAANVTAIAINGTDISFNLTAPATNASGTAPISAENATAGQADSFNGSRSPSSDRTSQLIKESLRRLARGRGQGHGQGDRLGGGRGLGRGLRTRDVEQDAEDANANDAVQGDGGDAPVENSEAADVDAVDGALATNATADLNGTLGSNGTAIVNGTLAFNATTGLNETGIAAQSGTNLTAAGCVKNSADAVVPGVPQTDGVDVPGLPDDPAAAAVMVEETKEVMESSDGSESGVDANDAVDANDEVQANDEMDANSQVSEVDANSEGDGTYK